MDKKYIPISKMAAMHNLSRQTLIYYDKCGLFKPAYTNEKGYRFYRLSQIPILREICLMKNIGFSLEEIKESFENRNPVSIYALLKSKLKKLESEIFELEQKRTYIQHRLEIYDHLSVKIKNINLPHVEWLPERQVIFVPFEKDHMEKNQLHLTLMKAWDILSKHKMIPSKGFGALLRYESICQNNPLKNAGSIIILPYDKCNYHIKNLITIPEGEYVIMYKYGMPYDMEPVYKLMRWIDEHHFNVVGDIVDLCLMDTTFYNTEHNTDFCCLQVPIK
ncbi:transcriptional regulator, MerR family [Thermoanaerobacterium thermosaccharolyticum DSM 571]|jgi:DNA-binding transcriptional MerR regulator/effector-binding domain-containing protein|uniref:Transcriptional regulator, MerR family n=1 Tax=Thermoanaerobacterium thermosaccharolyticum (strain ATCC 7956 / DSM 571 / NCIMB 9385 / NCA 3814 / NCTC 13789 / WDCM 00135 / 2032) TaxID=580327 RepID=D9TTI5_THETC|nr:MerR family transcriptional regulator [Thermoanaerobacterium thermosaccharolyticum]ADL68242.1 transcriptional regulator, MerR family [Thermoanaerobacterium thermosaccharolyticum DSM 571]